jgi:cytochrome c553
VGAFLDFPVRYAAVARFAVVLFAALNCQLLAIEQPTDDFFEKQVRPILAARCFECHSRQTDKPQGGLRLDSRAATLKGGDTGPAVVPGKPKESLLVDAINYGELYQMPPKSRLPVEEIAVLTKWVEMGAPWPEESVTARATYAGAFDLAKRKAEHWCWQPIERVSPPAVKNEDWVRQPLDRFILSKLEENGLSPALPADPRILVRRAYFDLIGLPPGAEELQTPASDYEALIDRLLASPYFGERWGRHWLDLVRYAETRGHEFDYEIPNAFEYRDYVVRALNADVPYDQLVVEHVAGDLLGQPRQHPAERFNESIIGTGFWFLGEWCHSPVDIRKDECERIDNMIDVFSKTFLGVTVACARCHDHKFDAISQRDYYALAGYLQSSSYRLTRFEQWESDRRLAAELRSVDSRYRSQITAAVAKALQSQKEELARSLLSDAETLVTELGLPQWDLKGAKVIVDYATLPEDAWRADGPTFGNGPLKPGQIVLTGEANAPLEAVEYSAARRNLAIGELEASKISQNDPGRLGSWLRAGRTLKTPTFTLKSGHVHYLVEGAGQVYAAVDSHAMINGPLHAELVKETGGNSDLPTRWITQDLSRYIGHRAHLEFSPKEGEDFRLLMVVEGSQRPAAPVNCPNRLLEQLIAAKGAGPTDSALAACRELIEKTLDLLAVDGLADDAAPGDRAAIANWLIQRLPEGEVASLVTDYSAARKRLVESFARESRLCLAMWQGTPVNENLLIRGNHKTVGPAIERRWLEALQKSEILSQRSEVGRLELTKQLIDPTNPLVSRVMGLCRASITSARSARRRRTRSCLTIWRTNSCATAGR